MGSGANPGRPMTIEEWATLDEDVGGEFVDGYLEDEEMPSFLHGLVNGWLVENLRRWARRRGGFVASSDAKYAVSATRGRKPDAAVYLDGRRPTAEGLIHDPPDLVFEVVSHNPRDARRDRIHKLQEYAAFGIKLYGLIDPALRSLEVFELGADGRYVRAVGASEGCVSNIPGCGVLLLDLDELWREVDDLLAAERDSTVGTSG
ncbi:Uma2 family endonuclease [Pendulispora rubella]|uniref:Uma2 family endonuclease n=1 Tax=Pendulispora rubella TaxID=2741070 RepID=A0ABZ2L3K4_9BACT